MEKKLKVVYLPLTKANWINPELEKAREDSRKFLASLTGVTVIGGEKMIEDEASAEGLDTDLFVRGNPLKVKFDAGCDALRNELLNNGWEHHFSMAYGDLTEELLALGRAWNIETTIVR